MSAGVGGHHIEAAELGTCWHCGQPTRWVDICFEDYLCPGACSEAKEDEFWAALARLPDGPDEPPEGWG